MTLRSLTAALVAGAALVAAPAPAVAAAKSSKAVVCASRASLYETPGHLVVGAVSAGDAVTVLARTENGRWVRVRTSFRVRGWLASRHLCGKGGRGR